MRSHGVDKAGKLTVAPGQVNDDDDDDVNAS